MPTGITCNPPPDIPHGRHSGHLMDTFSYMDVVNYTCDPNRLLAGEPSIFCTTVDGEHGLWSGPPPRCGGRAVPAGEIHYCMAEGMTVAMAGAAPTDREAANMADILKEFKRSPSSGFKVGF